MGGLDKGLQALQGRPLVEHAIERLRPQVGQLAISANRNVDVYRRYGFPVWPDVPPGGGGAVGAPAHAGTPTAPANAPADAISAAGTAGVDTAGANARAGVDINPSHFAGPLAGIAAGLAAARTEWLLVVPCDAPLFPLDLADALIEALVISTADLAFAATTEADGSRAQHPVFALLPTRLAASAAQQLASGAGKLRAWYGHHNAVEVGFCDSRAFYNANTLRELQALER
jgi:molybdopterin-guanine dinucleotide biosynthesis protein A